MKKAELKLRDEIKVHPHCELEGVLEFIVKDRQGNVVDRRREKNIVKIFAKEILSHRLPFSKIWNPVGGTGSGAWEDSGIDPNEEFAAKYILFGASFDANGVPLDVNDDRYYTTDPVTNTRVPIRLGVGAEYDGGLINAIPIAEPNRSLKKIESIGFEPTGQPAGTPLLQEDVRTINNIVTLTTTLRLEEYNGFGLTDSDYFTICEVALAAGRTIDTSPCCECDPKDIFLQGNADGTPIAVTANGTDVVTILPTETLVDLIKQGDQVKLVGSAGSGGTDPLDQVTPYYLVVSKLAGGRDIQLDRVPTDRAQHPITGTIGAYRDTLRIFSMRILSSPIKKSNAFEIICKWSILFS